MTHSKRALAFGGLATLLYLPTLFLCLGDHGCTTTQWGIFGVWVFVTGAITTLTHMTASKTRGRRASGTTSATPTMPGTLPPPRKALLKQASDRIVAYLCHEVRNPVHNLASILESLRTRMRPNELKDMEGAIEHLTTVTNDVLDFKSLVSGHFRLSNRSLKVESLVRSVAQSLAPLAQPGVTVRVAANPSFTGPVFVDPRRMEQVISKGIANGIRFTMSGTVTIRMGMTHDTRTGTSGWLVFVDVENTGAGLPRVPRRLLFTPFTTVARRFDGNESRGSEATDVSNFAEEEDPEKAFTEDHFHRLTQSMIHSLSSVRETWVDLPRVPVPGKAAPTTMKGTGVSLARLFAKAMGGWVDLWDDPQGRTHFTAWFGVTRDTLVKVAMPGDRIPQTPQGPPRPPPESDATTTAIQGTRFVVVDDQDVNRRIGRRMLFALGKPEEEVILLKSGEEARTWIRQHRDDGVQTIILMDIVMRDVSGVRAMRDAKPKAPLYAVAMTGNLEPRHIQSYRKAGFRGVLAKPFNKNYLAKAIQDTLSPVNGFFILNMPLLREAESEDADSLSTTSEGEEKKE